MSNDVYCSKKQTNTPFSGHWKVENYGCAKKEEWSPDEDLITIENSEIHFDNGGGGFANGPYTVSVVGGKKTIVKVRADGKERIVFG